MRRWFGLHGIKVIYKISCIIAVIILGIWNVYLYSLDEDFVQINSRVFNGKPDSVYPSVSFFFYSPYINEAFQKYGNKISSSDYIQFLQGNQWRKELADIDYNDVTIDIKNYFLGFDIHYDDQSRIIYNSTIPKNSEWKPPYSSSNSSFGKMFTVDIPFQKDMQLRQLEIKLSTKIFSDELRPSKVTINDGMDGFLLFFHYPNQISAVKRFMKSTWPVREKNDSRTYSMSFTLKNIEVMQSRNTWKQVCLKGLPNIDKIVGKSYFAKLPTCQPPYSYTPSNRKRCNNKEDVKKWHEATMFYHLSNNNLIDPPCRSLEKLEFDYNEYDYPEVEENYITISFYFVETKYRETLSIRAFDWHSLFGNIGGYVGMFLGYALLSVPDAILNLVTIMKNKGKPSSKIDNISDENGQEETRDYRLTVVEEHVRQIQHALSHKNENKGQGY